MQNYKNHSRLYPFHHFLITPLTLVLFVWSCAKLIHGTGSIGNRLFFVLLTLTIVLISFVARIYATKNQDRIIRTEMRQRFFEITGKSFSLFENKLKTGQIVALRFAGDDELEALTNRAVSENLSNKDIKLAIKNWKADEHRV